MHPAGLSRDGEFPRIPKRKSASVCFLIGLLTAGSIVAKAEVVSAVGMDEKIAHLEDAVKALQLELLELRSQAEYLPASQHAPRVERSVTANAAAARPSPPKSSQLNISGDFRLRFENTSAYGDLPDRSRGVLRGRLGAKFDVTNSLTAGARITTGDAGDPNSADITMGQFVDDLEVSLDQAYLAYRIGRNSLVGGKFSNPLVRTDLVWDGDVNPYGAAMQLELLPIGDSTLSLTSIYSIVDEQVVDDDSDMHGVQISLGTKLNSHFNLDLSAAYYDFEIGSLANADAGDIRGNLLSSGGSAYLSDFNLFDIVAAVEYSGLGEAWPLRITADYVRNTGARVSEDTGYSLQVGVGRLSEIGDWHFQYGYSMTETDAVLAAVANDNISYATNYNLHAFAVDYVFAPKTVFDLTVYRFRRDKFDSVLQSGTNDFVNRIRINMNVSF